MPGERYLCRPGRPAKKFYPALFERSILDRAETFAFCCFQIIRSISSLALLIVEQYVAKPSWRNQRLRYSGRRFVDIISIAADQQAFCIN
ncbi:hypothetical protein BRAO285_2290016 [Bradyrhizobium sp. ORS 285]|nr:hypothetical protein BRAO285_2290016 [Bradyrhizobium sp. ORS 285]